MFSRCSWVLFLEVATPIETDLRLVQVAAVEILATSEFLTTRHLGGALGVLHTYAV